MIPGSYCTDREIFFLLKPFYYQVSDRAAAAKQAAESAKWHLFIDLATGERLYTLDNKTGASSWVE